MQHTLGVHGPFKLERSFESHASIQIFLVKTKCALISLLEVIVERGVHAQAVGAVSTSRW
jgi:hypothetical protein